MIHHATTFFMRLNFNLYHFNFIALILTPFCSFLFVFLSWQVGAAAAPLFVFTMLHSPKDGIPRREKAHVALYMTLGRKIMLICLALCLNRELKSGPRIRHIPTFCGKFKMSVHLNLIGLLGRLSIRLVML